MEGKWTICPGPQPDTIFQSQNLVHFLCKYQKRETPSQVREGEATALRLGQYYLEDEETERSFFLPPHPFQSEDRNTTVCKGKGDSTIFLFFRLDFVEGGAWVCLPPPPSKTGLNPTSGCFRERLSRKFGDRERGGCFLEGDPRQGRWEEEPKGATEASS